jgi:hypothetical protein
MDAIKYFHNLAHQLPQAIEKGLEKVGEIAYESVVKTEQFKNYGNNGLRTATKIIPDGSYAIEVLSDKPYAYWVEEGNNQKGPFIYPVRAQFLHFFIDGDEIFAKKVRSHGPLPYFTDARNEAENSIQDIMEHEIKKLIGEMNG